MKFKKGDEVFVLTEPKSEYTVVSTNGYNRVQIQDKYTGVLKWVDPDDIDFIQDMYDNHGWF